jgi:radical SAM superfamily enzyme YgiQ (UPF0313 family)
MSGMTVAVLSEIVNSLPHWQLERFFVPWNPFAESTGIEHQLSLNLVDVIGFTTQFEVDYLALGWFLKRAKIPIDNLQRKKGKGKYPPLFLGGPCAFANPFPLLDIADGFFLGDAEISLPAFLRLLEQKGMEQFWNDPNSFQEMPGFWSPHFLELKDKKKYSDLFIDKNFEEVAGEWYSRAQFPDLNEVTYPLTQIVTELPSHHPYAPYKGQSFQLEIGRGCDHGCRFCMISKLLKRGRFRSLEKLLEILEEGVKQTGVDTVDVFGTNLSEFPKLTDLCWEIVNRGYNISLATLRPDRVTQDLLEALHEGGQESITIATETGTERLRKAVGKPMSDEKIYQAVELISEAKITTLKNFFLLGLRTEDGRNYCFADIFGIYTQEYALLGAGGKEADFQGSFVWYSYFAAQRYKEWSNRLSIFKPSDIRYFPAFSNLDEFIAKFVNLFRRFGKTDARSAKFETIIDLRV